MFLSEDEVEGGDEEEDEELFFAIGKNMALPSFCHSFFMAVPFSGDASAIVLLSDGDGEMMAVPSSVQRLAAPALPAIVFCFLYSFCLQRSFSRRG